MITALVTCCLFLLAIALKYLSLNAKPDVMSVLQESVLSLAIIDAVHHDILTGVNNRWADCSNWDK